MAPSWKEPLRDALAHSRRLALVGVGQELRGDDAAGVILARRLQRLFASSPPESDPQSPRWCFEAGSQPEASAGPLRRFGPDRVIFLDAAELGEPPGSVRWIEPGQLETGRLGTHTFPMSGFGAYLESELGCRVVILGIQPQQMDFDTPVSDPVRSAIERIFAVFAAAH
jgi:hydrogenase 3 maturation protease